MAPTISKTTVNAADQLRDISCGLGYDPAMLTVEQKTDIAERLSKMVNRGEVWGWRYVHNVLAGKMPASREMQDAIMRLGASLDGTPDILAKAKPVQCLALGDVRAGALILTDSRRCKNPACGLSFIPTARHQAYHDITCKRAWEREIKRQRRAEAKQNGH